MKQTEEKKPFPSSFLGWGWGRGGGGAVLARPKLISLRVCLRINSSQIMLGRPDIWRAITRPWSHRMHGTTISEFYMQRSQELQLVAS